MPSPFVGDPGISPGAEAGRVAVNQLGLDPSLLSDFVVPERVPRTRTRTSHGLTLRVTGGRVIGAVNAVGESQTRAVDEEWEINRSAHGAGPADIIPQNVTTRTLKISRYDLYVQHMEEVFNQTGEMVSLSDQFRPFSLRTIWQSPVGIVLGGRRVYEYVGCWFTNLGRNVRSDDNRIINVDADVVYQYRRRIL